MTAVYLSLLLSLTSTVAEVLAAEQSRSGRPEIVAVQSGPVTLHGMLWRPKGSGRFPAVLLNHGSGRSPEELRRLGPYEGQAEILGPVFARHGYVFLFLFRRGVGLSTDQGQSAVDLLNSAVAAHGQDARNALQLDLLEGREMSDALSGLAFLKHLPDVDPRKLALVGHSFGGSLTVLMAEREPELRALVVFSAAGYSLDRSPALQSRLLAAAEHVAAPVFFFIHAANDYSTASGRVLSERLQQLGKPHRVKIYPACGETAEDGHNFLFLGVDSWEPDVFAFLDAQMRR
jgi:carboxymethylenebutenolidase